MLVCSTTPRTDHHSKQSLISIRPDTQLADRNAVATARPAQANARDATNTPPSLDSKSQPKTRSQVPLTDQSPDPSAIDRLRADLGATQKARTALATQVGDLTSAVDTLKAQDKEKTTQIVLLTRRKTEIERKLHDRDEELRGKLRLVQHAQDEMIAQGLQLHMAEQRTEKLEKENKELVDRWMKRVGEEAEKVNRDSKWS